MPTPKPPTPQGISALLRKAGFERSDYGRKGVMWNEATTGFSAWKTFHSDAPGQPYIAVQHIEAGMHIGGDEGWSAYLKTARAHLERYAAVLREAGFAAVVRDRGKEPPWLTILTVVADEEA